MSASMSVFCCGPLNQRCERRDATEMRQVTPGAKAKSCTAKYSLPQRNVSLSFVLFDFLPNSKVALQTLFATPLTIGSLSNIVDDDVSAIVVSVDVQCASRCPDDACGQNQIRSTDGRIIHEAHTHQKNEMNKESNSEP